MCCFAKGPKEILRAPLFCELLAHILHKGGRRMKNFYRHSKQLRKHQQHLFQLQFVRVVL